MKRSFLDRVALAALAATTLTPVDRAFAGPADTRRVEELERDNAAMRARIRRLEAEKDNVSLRARLDQLETGRGVAAAPAAKESAPVRLSADAPDRTLVLSDMPMKAAPPLPRFYSWTGFYIGGNIGYSVGSDRTTGALVTPQVVNQSGASFLAPAGAIGGGQLGYNWQARPNWLVGFEADFQGSSQKSPASCVLVCEVAPGVLTQQFTAQHKLDYFGTVRGRIGFVHNDALFYITGGGAFGRVGQTLGSRIEIGAAASTGISSSWENKFGYVVGGGIEAALGGNWTGKIEYLYMDLGSTSTTLNGVLPVTPAIPFTYSATATIRDHIVRTGLNYRFGGERAALTAYNSLAAAPGALDGPYAWTGFYVGANVGYGLGNNRVTQSQLLVTAEPGTSIMPKGIMGGAQLGYNWQGGRNWLIGFEADLQGAGQSDTSCAPSFCVTSNTLTGIPNSQGSAVFTVEHQLDYFGTIRGRLGAVDAGLLYYMTGGAAFARVRQSVDVKSALFGSPPLFANASSTANMIGWTAGGGIEAALWGGWTAKAEYLYMDLGSITTIVNADIRASRGQASALPTTSTIRDHVVRVGTNYRF